MSFVIKAVDNREVARAVDQPLKEFGRRIASENWNTTTDWEPKPGYCYSVVRAISARINQNYDGWPADELKRAAHTFVGKPIFVNHNNDDPQRARGVVVAARYVESGNDKYVEVVQEVDAERYPKLAKEIIDGGLDSVSMGAEAGHTICSACDNKALTDNDLCDHVKYHKGEKIRVAGKSEPVLVWEKCGNIGFFELSYVFEPADETAVVSKVLHASKRQAQEHGPDMTVGDAPFSPISLVQGVPGMDDSGEEDGLLSGGGLAALGKGQEGAAPTHSLNQDLTGPGSIGEALMGAPAVSSAPSGSADPQAYSPLAMKVWGKPMQKSAFGETEAPESIDTLRDEDDHSEEDFHHYVEAPAELKDPDLSRAHQIDRQQENKGLDRDRRVEDISAVDENGAALDPGAARDEAGTDGDGSEVGHCEAIIEDYAQFVINTGAEPGPESVAMWAEQSQAGPEEIDVVMGFLDQVAQEDPAIPAENAVDANPSFGKEGRDMKGSTTMSRGSLSDRARVASSGQKHYAHDGHVDGGDQSRQDQGEQEEVFITQTPGTETVEAPDRGDPTISNTEQNLVAALTASTQQTQYLAGKLDAFRRFAYDENAPFWNDNSWADKKAPVAKGKPNVPHSDYKPGSGVDKKEASLHVADGTLDEVGEHATVVDPPLSGTNDQSQKGDNFVSADPNANVVETVTASQNAFRAFDKWLANNQNVQRTAGLYKNEKFIVGQVKRWAKEANVDPRVMFPTLADALRVAKKKEAENSSLEVAAPQERIDVEAPTAGTTDADAQGTYDSNDYDHNSGDSLADPDLSTTGWTPGDAKGSKTSSVKLADAGQAVRLAEAYIDAGLLPKESKWEAVAGFQKMRAGQIVDRTHLLEATINQVINPLKQRVASGSRRGTVPQGIPTGAGSAGMSRQAATYHVAANDPSNDIELFL